MLTERILLVHPFLLHYHFARLGELSQACGRTGITMFSLELASYSDQYRTLHEAEGGKFGNTILFPGKSLEELSTREVWPAVKQQLTALRPDVVFVYGYCLGIMRQIVLWAKIRGVGVVLISDSNEADRPRYRPLQFLKSRFVSLADAGFVGGTTSALYLQKLGLPAERVMTGYDVVDNEAFQSRMLENERFLPQLRERWHFPESFFLFVGRLIKEKNLERLLAAYGKYAESLGSGVAPWSLAVAGSGPEEENLRRLTVAMPPHLRGHIRFCGLVRQYDLPDFYSCASCLVLPSTYETWGLVVNEAMACGLPVLVSRRAGCSADLVQDDVTGWSFDPCNVDQLAGLMAKIHQMDDCDRARVGEGGRRLIAAWGLQKFAQSALDCARIASSRQ